MSESSSWWFAHVSEIVVESVPNAELDLATASVEKSSGTAASSSAGEAGSGGKS